MATLTHTQQGWKCDVHINNRRIRQILSRDRAKAKRILKEMIEAGRAKRTGRVVHDMTWDFFQADHLRFCKSQRNIKTYNSRKRSFEMFNSAVHAHKLSDVTPGLLIEAQTRLIEKKFRNIPGCMRGMLTAMRWAEDSEYIDLQNWRRVKYETNQGRFDFYDEHKFFELLEKLDGFSKTSAWIMGRAGLRPGEALFLEWHDVQFENNRIIFRSKPEFNFKIKADKKGKKLRVIPMYPDLREYLWSIRKDSGFVLEPSCVRRVDSFGKVLTDALEAAKVPTYHKIKAIPYTLRHTFASHLTQRGVSEKIIAELMGHEDTSMVKIYAHLRPVDMEHAVKNSKKCVSTLCPPLNSERLSTPLLMHSSENSVIGHLSSEILRND